jgi:hypothetical protein
VRRLLVLVPAALLLLGAAFYVAGSFTVGGASSSPESGVTHSSLSQPVIAGEKAWCRSAFTTVVLRPSGGQAGEPLRSCMPEAHHRVYLGALIAAGAMALIAVGQFATRRRQRPEGVLLDGA